MQRTEALAKRTGSSTAAARNRPRRSGEYSSAHRPGLDVPARTHHATHVLNFALAVLALMVVLPLLLVIALAIKLSSSGPVLYTQERVGLDRRRRTPAG